ncbi:hypothetical protein CYJ73_24130 [Gordonia terrae]|uniref:Uncharacterized protein n=1 Tax=Gordonia terrae TaxID=2055 RepID=A0A2I1R1H2_9ACTN|nr:hypothetical protein [Gordonia terrae]PKZ62969.1 hypothetical protein CYJ73_24130 [Gordonia terrae]
MSTERSTFDELGRQSDVPSLGLPREQLLTYAMFARTAAGALRSARERHGRAAWNDADEAARIHLAADAAAIDELTPTQAQEWNQRVAEGNVGIDRVGDSGMVMAYAGLGDGTEVVQATLGDRTVTVAAGSPATAAHIREWLAANPSHDALSDLRQTARDIAADRTEDAPAAAADDHAGQQQPEEDRAAISIDELTAPTLRERLGDRVPQSVFDDARWATAERQFRDLVREGVDPALLADAAGGLTFDHKVRSPAGLVAWQLRKAAQGHTAPTDEDQARREAATEWLAAAEDTPTDRARASRLVGQIDTEFDRALAEKYPGILTPAADSEDRWHDHAARAATHTDLADTHDDTAVREEEAVAHAAQRVTDAELAVVGGPVADERVDPVVERGDADTHDAIAADERDLAADAEGDRAEQAASKKAAAAPLTRGAVATAANRSRGRASTPRAASAARTNTQTRTRGRTQ